MRIIVHRVLRFLLSIVTGTSSRNRFVIFGVRRSGNHALTNWLTNAIEESNSTLTAIGHTPPLSHCFVSNTGSVVHFNELNELSVQASFSLFLQSRKLTRKCKYLLISFEDVRPSEYENFRRLKGTEVYISRNSLEVISSRFHNINKKAQKGIGWSRQTCDDYFMQTQFEFLNRRRSDQLNWDYNLWLTDEDWRRKFLERIGLKKDLKPDHSGVGGGSSFHGTSGEIETNLTQRMTKVQPQNAWTSFLDNLLKEHPTLFNTEELRIAEEFLQRED